MSSSRPVHVLFRGLLNDFDDDDVDDIEYGELDSMTFGLFDEINRLQPNRHPHLELDHFDDTGIIELIFRFNITWMDRDGDIDEYIIEVQNVIENGLNVLIIDKEALTH